MTKFNQPKLAIKTDHAYCKGSAYFNNSDILTLSASNGLADRAEETMQTSAGFKLFFK